MKTMGRDPEEHLRELERDLAQIEPAFTERGERFYPCAVELVDGGCLPAVYVIDPFDPLRSGQNRSPEILQGQTFIRPGNVLTIRESPMRLPPKFSAQLRQAGETGMGYWFFTVVFSWWRRRTYLQSQVDFIEYPKGKSGRNVTSVIALPPSRTEASLTSKFPIYCCLLK